jgi:biotin transport system substrate-specific component
MRNEMTGSALAPALWPATVNPAVRNVVLIVAGSALLTLSAKISVPFWPVPMTLQTFAIMVIAASYGRWLGVATVLVYLAQGFVGLPVFANTPPLVAGPSYFLGTTGGFLVGFIAAAYIVGWAADRGWDRSVFKLAAAMLVADAAIFLLGFVWLAWFAQLASGGVGIGIASAWTNGVANFLLADIVKIALAACLIPAGWALLKRRGA